MNRLSTTFETKELTDGGEYYTVKGYASVFGNKDLDDDVIEKGAFAASLKSRHPQFLWGHDMSSVPIGRVSIIAEDAKGLYFEAEMPKDDERVKGQIAPQLRIGSIKGVSIGFRIKERGHQKDGSRIIKQAELYEISLVNVPANPLASVDHFKSIGGVLPYADLPLAKIDRPWDPVSALERVKAHTGSENDPSASFKEAFLYVDPGASDDASSYKFLVADVIEGRLTAVPAAIFKAATELMRCKGDDIKSSDREVLQGNLDRYYARLDLGTSTKAFAKCEWNALEAGEREARLRSLGLSGGLAKALSGQRDVGRSPRDAGPSAEDFAKSLRAIEALAKGLKTNEHT